MELFNPHFETMKKKWKKLCKYFPLHEKIKTREHIYEDRIPK